MSAIGEGLVWLLGLDALAVVLILSVGLNVIFILRILPVVYWVAEVLERFTGGARGKKPKEGIWGFLESPIGQGIAGKVLSGIGNEPSSAVRDIRR